MKRQRIRRWSLDTAIRMCERSKVDLERGRLRDLPLEFVRSEVAALMVLLTPRMKEQGRR